jgi:hypothetical protein
MNIKEAKSKLSDFITYTQDSIEKIKTFLQQDTQVNHIRNDLITITEQIEQVKNCCYRK